MAPLLRTVWRVSAVEWQVSDAQPCPCPTCVALLPTGEHNEAESHCWCGPEVHSALCASNVIVHREFRG